MVNTGLAVIAGEVTSNSEVDLAQTVRDTIKDIGYNSSEMGFDYSSCAVMVTLDKQSVDIAQGVNEGEGLDRDQGAGDQGLMFGYACNETDVLMPFPITYSHRLVKRQAEVRKSGGLSWLRPDAKSQVSVRYEDGKPVSVDTVVLSTQHSEDVDHATLSEAVIEEIIKPVLPADMITSDTRFLVNPTGRFVIGGPHGDCGLTGRKIIVDTYEQCEAQVAYAIGVAEPVSLMVSTNGTAAIAEDKIEALIREHFDLRPKGIIEDLDLLRPIYRPTAAYGHFGRSEDGLFPWEQTDKVDALRAAAGL